MKTDAALQSMAEMIADGFDNYTADDVRELAVFALAMQADRDLERQARHAAETALKQMTLAVVMRQATDDAFKRAGEVVDALASENDAYDTDYFARAEGPVEQPEWLTVLRNAGAL